MLLQGFACDAQGAFAPAVNNINNNTNNNSAGLTLASPPASPPQLSAPNTLGHLFDSCRSLQALLASPQPYFTPSASTSTSTSLTPPLAHAPSPMKLRLRVRAADADASCPPTPSSAKRIVKRQPVRGANKRRRDVDDDGREGAEEYLEASPLGLQSSPLGLQSSPSFQLAPSPMRRYRESTPVASTPTITVSPVPFSLPSSNGRPTTPKRARIAPNELPLGLERADFHALHNGGVPDDSLSQTQGTEIEREADGAEWSIEDDRMLVELVLEKLRLSKEEWQDCARTLGRDRASLGRRWKSLVLHNDVGFKGGRPRGKIHGTWR